MSEATGAIETRSRSRSKTPGLLFGENGDSAEGGVKKGSKKVPTVSLIEEEEVVEVASSQSQRPKRQRRSAKAINSDTSGGDVESPKNSQQTTKASEGKSSQKEVTNGSKEDESPANNGASEAPENQGNIFNNIFNAIKTSTPILSSTKKSKRITQEVKSNTSPTIDIKQHPAYKEYREAGEYWNKYPKTDYTYSELSPHRRHLGNGVVNMPNMSRRSLEKYTQRVEAMIQNNPQEESFLRRKFLSNSFQKRSAELQYDSADEVDVSDLHRSLIFRRQKQTNFFYRFYTLIISFLSSAYSNARSGVRKIFYYRPSNQTPIRYTYTPVKNYGQSGTQRVFNAVQKFVLLCASKVYLLISTVLCFDTWLLYTRSANLVENQKRKRSSLALLALLPLLIFGGTYIYLDPPQNFNISFPKITLPAMPKITLPSWPVISWPEFSLPSWFKLPSFTITWPEISLPSLPSFSWPEFSLPSLSWPAWLVLPAITLPSLPSFSWPEFSLPEWFKLPSFSFNWPEISLPSLPSFSWPEFSLPEWFKLPSFSFNWPEFSLPSLPTITWPEFSLPEWFKLPSFSFNWPEFSLPSLPTITWPKISLPTLPTIDMPSFDFISPVTSYATNAFVSFKESSVELFDKVREATVGLLNEAQIVWSENFNGK